MRDICGTSGDHQCGECDRGGCGGVFAVGGTDTHPAEGDLYPLAEANEALKELKAEVLTRGRAETVG